MVGLVAPIHVFDLKRFFQDVDARREAGDDGSGAVLV